MGLSMSIRIVRKSAKAIEISNFGNATYREKDYKELVYDTGRGAYGWLRKWVNDDLYGQYIRLSRDDVRELLDAAINDFVDVNEYDLPDLSIGIEKTIGVLSLWQLYDKLGWYMEIECDW